MPSFAGLDHRSRDWQWGWLALSSAAMALVILTRPAGMFLIVTYALIAAWLLWQRISWRPLFGFRDSVPAVDGCDERLQPALRRRVRADYVG